MCLRLASQHIFATTFEGLCFPPTIPTCKGLKQRNPASHPSWTQAVTTQRHPLWSMREEISGALLVAGTHQSQHIHILSKLEGSTLILQINAFRTLTPLEWCTTSDENYRNTFPTPLVNSDSAGSRASSESSRREKLPGEVDDGVELTGEMCAPRSKRGDAANAGTANTETATGRTVVAQNGNSITGFTGGKSRKSPGPSGSGPPGPPSSATSSTNERRRSPRRLSGSSGSGTADRADSEGHDIRGSSAAAARTAPAQLRNFLERAHQEANALYTSGALNGFRSRVGLHSRACTLGYFRILYEFVV